jgi:hypothetical protein
MGWPLLLCAFAGLLGSFFRGDDRRKTLAVFSVFYYAVLVFGGQAYARYVLFLLPWLIIFAVDFIIDLARKIRPRRQAALAVLGILLLALPAASRSLLIGRTALSEDTRTEARSWILANIPAGSSIALDHDFFGPRLNFSKKQLEEKLGRMAEIHDFSGGRRRRLEHLLAETAGGVSGYDLYYLSVDPEKADRPLLATPLLPFDWRVLQTLGIEYAVTSLRTTTMETFYRDLEENSELVAEFNPYRKEPENDGRLVDPVAVTGLPLLFEDLIARKRAGPPVKIYRLRRR